MLGSETGCGRTCGYCPRFAFFHAGERLARCVLHCVSTTMHPGTTWTGNGKRRARSRGGHQHLQCVPQLEIVNPCGLHVMNKSDHFAGQRACEVWDFWNGGGVVDALQSGVMWIVPGYFWHHSWPVAGTLGGHTLQQHSDFAGQKKWQLRRLLASEMRSAAKIGAWCYSRH
jgi:hypothetical protein